MVNCHCSLCRKFHGHFGAYTAANREHVHVNDKNGYLTWFHSSHNNARRGFCINCGSSLFWDMDGAATLSIAAGTLDKPTKLKTTTEIFTDNKGDYYELYNSLIHIENGLSS